MTNSSHRRPAPGLTGSIATHLLAIGALILITRHTPNALHPLHLPGTLQGRHMMLTYNVGGPAEARQSSLIHEHAQPAPKPTAPQPKLQPTPAAPSAPSSELGRGTSGDSAFGDENVRIALPQIHPRPQPDLSALPHGTAGDVVVDVLIDDTGKVTTTTLVKGLGAPVDTAVMQALQAWTFTPATRNGQNIASEQEILIHYEHG